jgi:hypothetical protein
MKQPLNPAPETTINRPVIFLVHCNLKKEDAFWNELLEFSVEIGYPAIKGGELWKHVGALHIPQQTVHKSFVHAVWNKEQCQHQLEFDFLPVLKAPNGQLNKKYRIKIIQTLRSGRRKTIKSKILSGDYKDQWIIIQTKYP